MYDAPAVFCRSIFFLFLRETMDENAGWSCGPTAIPCGKRRNLRKRGKMTGAEEKWGGGKNLS